MDRVRDEMNSIRSTNKDIFSTSLVDRIHLASLPSICGPDIGILIEYGESLDIVFALSDEKSDFKLTYAECSFCIEKAHCLKLTFYKRDYNNDITTGDFKSCSDCLEPVLQWRDSIADDVDNSEFAAELL